MEWDASLRGGALTEPERTQDIHLWLPLLLPWSLGLGVVQRRASRLGDQAEFYSGTTQLGWQRVASRGRASTYRQPAAGRVAGRSTRGQYPQTAPLGLDPRNVAGLAVKKAP